MGVSPKEFSKSLKYYKREEVQDLILNYASDKEVSPMYGEGFGKRPDVLEYRKDILELARNRATSFHCSEELWKNPLRLKTGLKSSKLNELRKGWDLILDIDCPYWFFSRLTAKLFMDALKKHGLKSVTCKFSGNKGFHIGVPWEAFPEEFDNTKTKNLFPEAPKKIASYLLNHISEEMIEVSDNKIVFNRRYRISFEKLKEVTGKDNEELLKEICANCRKEIREKNKKEEMFICPSCNNRSEDQENLKCGECGGVMEKITTKKKKCACGSDKSFKVFDVLSLIEVDTILISQRHLYRMPYSLHEKSGLVSVPIDPSKVMEFKKEMAETDTELLGKHEFLVREEAERSEGEELFRKAFEEDKKEEEKGGEKRIIQVEEKVPKKFFPPCIKHLDEGLEDGRKRALFILINFLQCCSWTKEEIKDYVHEWNKRNRESLRETYVKSQLRYAEQKRKKGELIPPPNCDTSYYEDLGAGCTEKCKKFKNPVNYAKVKYKNSKKGKKGRPKLTEKQKEMRRKYREKKKKSKQQ